MRKIYFIISALLFGTAAFAQHRDSENILERLLWDDKMLNIMLDTRVDFQAKINNGETDNMGFEGQTIKIWLVGEIIPGIRYRVRHRLNKPQSPLREGYSGATDHAWLAFDIGRQWTITAGKQSVQLGTFEYDYNPADIYEGTLVYNDFDGYKTGVNAAFKVAGQTFNLQVVNSDAPQFANDEYKNKALAATFLWEGNLFSDVIRTRWGYGAFQHDKKKFYQWVTLGTQLNVSKFTAELDYYIGNRDIDYSEVVGVPDLGSRYVRDQSVLLNLKYYLGIWHPFVKGMWNQRHDKRAGRNAYQTKGIQAAMEVYPFKNKYVKDLRFHVAYAYANTDFQGEFEDHGKQDAHSLFVGTRWLFKVK